MLITHLYEYFGLLTGCSLVGQGSFPAYGGDTSMGNVHKFMDLDPFELGYFITQVGLSAASFGVANADVEIVGNALQQHFGYRCAPAEAIVPGAQPEIQSICTNPACPLAMNATCSLYANVSEPTYKNGTAFGSSGSSNSSMGGSSGSSSGSRSSSGNGMSGTGTAGGSATSTGASPAQATKNAGGRFVVDGVIEVVLTMVVALFLA